MGLGAFGGFIVRRFGSVAVAAFICLSSLVALAPAAVAAGDTTSPSVAWITSSHTAVDTIDGPVEITLQARLTDAESGVNPSGIRFGIGYASTYSPYMFANPQRVSGDTHDGVYEVRLTVPEYAKNGTWEAVILDIYDVAGNENMGQFGPRINVTSTVDSTPPAMDSDVPTTVDITDGPAAVVVTVSASDAQSGFESWAAPSLRLSNGGTYSFEAMTRVSGDAHAATYRSTLYFSAAGSYLVTINSAQLAWTAASGKGSALTSYTITELNSGAAITVPGTQTNLSWDGLTPGQRVFTVVATNAYGNSTSARSNQVTVYPLPLASPTAATPQAPAKMKAPRVVTRGSTILVKWVAPGANGSGIARYLVDISKGRDKKFVGTDRKATFKRLKPGVYRFRVAAQNAAGWSPFSPWVKVRIE